MRKYIRIYKKLLELNFANLTAYRANFINSIVSSVLWGLFTIAHILLLTSRVDSLFGWSREELILLTCVYNVIYGIFHLTFSRNFEYFSRVVHLGQLDTFLLKPVDSQFFLSFRYVNYTSIIRVLFGICLTAFFLGERIYSITIIDLVSFLFFAATGLVVLYSIWYLVTTLTVWFSRLDNLVDVLFVSSGIPRFPPEIFSNFSVYLFVFLLPLVLIVTTPTKQLIQRPDAFSNISIVVFAVLLFLASRMFWRFALRFYTSASS